MNLRIRSLVVLMLIAAQASAQWSIQPGIGVAAPISGYKTLSNSGLALQLDINKRLNNKKWSLGLMLAWAKLHNDNNSTDIFNNARLDQVPILLTADYEFGANKILPYAGVGLGVSFYNLSYEVTTTEGKTVNNVSFSMMPRTGLRLRLGNSFVPFIELNAPLVMDGPPQGVGESGKATGYIGLIAGAAYRF